MTIRSATREDLPALLRIYDGARAFLRENGIDQWQDGYPEPACVEADIRLGQLRVVEADETILGCAAFLGHEPDYDRIFNGAWRTDGAYLTVHRVATVRGRGAGSALLAAACAAAAERGCASVRIDTHADNRPMRALLRKSGFLPCGTIVLRRDGGRRIAFEKPLQAKTEPKRIVAATGNAGKLSEIRALLPDFTVVSQAEAGFCGEVEETGETFRENALIKARAVCSALGLPALADDSGICCAALGGAPGVYSARFAGRHGDDAANNRKLLQCLAGKDRTAWFFCAVALVFPDGRTLTAEGRTEGRILEAEVGQNGFGYDPLFYSTEIDKPFGLASPEEKNAVSHRYRALKALAEQI